MNLFHSDNLKAITVVGGTPKTYKKVFTQNEYTPWLRRLRNKQQEVGEVPPCVYGKPLIEYFNRKDVRAALHVPETVQSWDMCSDLISYTSGERGS